jgi:hypothetical protein
MNLIKASAISFLSLTIACHGKQDSDLPRTTADQDLYEDLEVESGPFFLADFDGSESVRYTVGVPDIAANWAYTSAGCFEGYGADSTPESWTSKNMCFKQILELEQGDIGLIDYNPTSQYNTLRVGNMFNWNSERCVDPQYHNIAECWLTLTNYIGVNPIVEADLSDEAGLAGGQMSIVTIAGDGLYAGDASI